MKIITLFGAGKSSTVLINYLLNHAEKEHWRLQVVDADLALATSKIQQSPNAEALSFNINDSTKRQEVIAQSNIIISLLPPSLHILVAKDCIAFKKDLLNASYIDADLQKLKPQIEKAGILFLCEMGLDPGIDHMSAKSMIDEIQSIGGHITSFISHCGGLVADECDDNPWHYKISWNPGNIVNAGKAGATFKFKGKTKKVGYKELFQEKRFVTIGKEILCWYPNRNSLPYMKAYNLENCKTFIRTTLRHPDFVFGWNHIIELKLTDDTMMYDTDGKTLMDFFTEHFERNNLKDWLQKKVEQQTNITQNLVSDLMALSTVEKETLVNSLTKIEDTQLLTNNGKKVGPEIDVADPKVVYTALQVHEAQLTLKQLFYLGLDDDKTLINKGKCSAADVLCFAVQAKLKLQEWDKDKVLMLHQIEYTKEGKNYKRESYINITGTNSLLTAMAKTVGLPLGIAAKMILKGQIQLKGLQIPTQKEIYAPILNELEQLNIAFKHATTEIQ